MDLEQLANQLYDPSRVGVECIPHFLREDERQALYNEAQQLTYEVMPANYGSAIQDFEMADARLDYEQTNNLFNRISTLCKELGTFAGFSNGPTEFLVNRYAKGASGISVHRDLKRNPNVIAIALVSGRAPFLAGRSKEELEVIDFVPGDLVLMRALRKSTETDTRPYHAVGRASEERITFIARYQKSYLC